MKQLVDKPEDALEVLQLMMDPRRAREPHDAALKGILVQCDGVKEALRHNRLALLEPHWGQAFALIGSRGINILQQIMHPRPWVARDLAELLVKKGQAYGVGPIESWGELGVAIRIDSKVMRYLNLTQNNQKSSAGDDLFESVIDTMQDIVGYAVLGYLFNQRKGN